jgi:hypothetical protein
MYEETFVNNKRIIHEKKNQNPTNKPKGKKSQLFKVQRLLQPPQCSLLTNNLHIEG